REAGASGDQRMSPLALLRLAVHGFSRHRMRALLTALGIIIGVAAFITTVALGRGASAKVGQQIASIGVNMLIVSGGSSNVGGVRGGSGSAGSAAPPPASPRAPGGPPPLRGRAAAPGDSTPRRAPGGRATGTP